MHRDDVHDGPAFSLTGAIIPNYVPVEFSVDECRAASIVPCEHKGLVQFGQPNGYPAVTWSDWSKSASLSPLGIPSFDDQPDFSTELGILAQHGWKVTRNKVCIQADTQLHCGTDLDKSKWGDNFVFAFFQTLEFSSTCMRYKDSKNEDNTVSIAKKYTPNYFPILDVNTFDGQEFVNPEKRDWVPYYSAVSKVGLAGMVKNIEERRNTKEEPATNQALSALISMGDMPSVDVPQSLDYNGSCFASPLLKDKNLCDATDKILFVLSSVEHHERYRSWLAVHDKNSGTVWPLTVFEWYFDVSAHAQGEKLVFDDGTPKTPTTPKIYTINDTSLPTFPHQVLKTSIDGKYTVANDQDMNNWERVYCS